MPETFLHGVEVIEIDSGPRPIQTVRSSVIGIVGTAPDSQQEAKASLLTGVGASNNALTWLSKLVGTLGNVITVRMVAPGTNNAALSVSVSGKTITVNLATNGSAVVTTTAAQVRTAILANADASALVKVSNTGGGGATATAAVGSGAVTSFTVTNGGSGYVTPPAVTIGGPGTGATATAVLTDGVVTSITVGTPGTGYSTAPAITIASPGSTGAGVVAAVNTSALTGGLDEAFPLNVPTLVAGSQLEASRLGTAGTLPSAMDSIFDQVGAVVIVVRVEEGEDDAETLANVIGGVNGTTGQYEGVHAFLGAESVVGFAPRILIATGFTHQRESTANAVVAELVGIAERLRAIIIADGPDTTDSAAITYAGDWGSPRIYLVDPGIQKVNTDTGLVETYHSSPMAAGLLAKSDNERGFWWSPSNQTINGIVGTTRAIDFSLGDQNSRANLLNERLVATIIRQNGYRLWGNRTLSSDPKWTFLSVRRTADIINDSLQRAHLWAVDRNITKTYLEDVTESVNAYLRDLTAIGAILGGRCWADPDLNTPSAIAQGKVYFDFEFTANYPAEHITFRSHLTQEFLTEIF